MRRTRSSSPASTTVHRSCRLPRPATSTSATSATVPPITGAAKQFGFKIVAVQRGADATKAAENIIVPKDSPIQTLADLKGKKHRHPAGQLGPRLGAARAQERRA